MTNDATPAADPTEQSTRLPIGGNLYAALALLRYAHDCAQDGHTSPWDFALGIGKLYEAGMTITDLRWLVVKEFVEHGGETSAYGDEHRSFTPSGGFNFLPTTCVLLTKKGAAFACQVLRVSAAAKASEETRAGDETAAPAGRIPATNGKSRPNARQKPLWNPARRELSLGGLLVKRFAVPARNQELILSAFQEEGWPDHIDDPLAHVPEITPKTRLNDVIYRLNHAQVRGLIRFHANGNGNGVLWSLCFSEGGC